MSMNKNSFILSLKIIKKRNRFNFLFVLCICMATLLPIVLFGTAQSLINQVHDSKKAVYGEFTDLYYMESEKSLNKDMWIEKQDISLYLPGYSYEKYGAFYTVLQANILSEDINIGYIDEVGLELGNIKIAQGVLPSKEKEIAVSEGVLDKLGNINLGEDILINGREYTVVGSFKEFGGLWPRGKKQIQENVNQINGIVSENEAALLHKECGFLNRLVLFKASPYDSNRIREDGNFYHNLNIQLAEEELFRIPEEFLFILYICSVVLLYNILSLSKETIKSRMNIYHLLGMRKKDIRNSFFMEYSLLALVGVFIGLLGGYLCNRILLYIIKLKLQINLNVYFGYDYFKIIAIILSTVVISELLFYYTSLVSVTQNRMVLGIKEKQRKPGFGDYCF